MLELQYRVKQLNVLLELQNIVSNSHLIQEFSSSCKNKCDGYDSETLISPPEIITGIVKKYTNKGLTLHHSLDATADN